MLHQNWFMNPRFEMFEDYGESQSFYDTETGIIYVVFEEYGIVGLGIMGGSFAKSIRERILCMSGSTEDRRRDPSPSGKAASAAGSGR